MADTPFSGLPDGGKLAAPVLDSYAVLEEVSAPNAPDANTLRLLRQG